MSPGGSISEPGFALVMLHLPMFLSAVLLLLMAFDKILRRKISGPLSVFFAYIAVVGLLWACTIYVKSNAAALLFFLLLFLAPWPVFIAVFVAFRRARREES